MCWGREFASATPGSSKPPQGAGAEEAQPEGDKLYFDSYANIGIHEAMLRDTVRTEGYYDGGAAAWGPSDTFCARSGSHVECMLTNAIPTLHPRDIVTAPLYWLICLVGKPPTPPFKKLSPEIVLAMLVIVSRKFDGGVQHSEPFHSPAAPPAQRHHAPQEAV